MPTGRIRTVHNVFKKCDRRLATSNFILDETISLCRYRLGHAAATSVGTVLRDSNTVDLIRATSENEQAVWILFCRRTDQRYSFTDCASLTVDGFRLVP